VFIDWFNRVWKRAPNEIADALDAGVTPPAALGREMARALDWFEALLAGRDFLFGGEASAADFIAFPFLKYAAAIDPTDDETFHQVLNRYQPLRDGHGRLAAWIDRVDELPRTPGV
jgi:glutathione S-transferase